ncbi:MAG: DNA polymerase III subunit alpha [Candidatus Magasanikbacteria bacterium]|nr:DNA polymerase III subunit alpha [Candidatus Magasanikbacteria bacterium]
MSDFVHLHTHTHYSLLNGLPKVKELVKIAKERGFKTISLTDYGSLYGAIEFYKTCKKEGIKPIIGFEAYIAETKMDEEDENAPYQMILLAENYEGYRNLMVLSSKGHLDGFKNDKPRIDKELLRKYSKGIIALSGPIEGEVPQFLKRGKTEQAEKSALEYNEIFGQDNFYLELQDHPAIEGQVKVNTQLIELSKKTGIPMVVTRDVHYMNPDEKDAQDILLCIGNGWRVDLPNRTDYRHVDRSYNSAEDIISRFRHVPEAIENTVKIADRVNLEIELDKWHFAPVDLPKGKTANEHLKDMAYKGFPGFYDELTDFLKERIEYELDIIKTKGYAPYFICVADYVNYAKRNGIVETTRGSAAGSLVSYILGITTVDPIRFKIPFERFLNPFRPSAPDVDTDFADDRRGEMIEYVTEKYGKDKVAQIITFGTMAARASVRDVGRALGLSYSFCDQVAKLIPTGAQGFPMTIQRALDEEPELKSLYDTNDDVERLLNLAQQVEGCARHTSIHAAGVVISPTPLTDFSPVQRETGGDRIITQYEMKSVESAGVLKNDFLGIRNLSILGNAVKIVEKTVGDKVDIYNLPLEDVNVFKMLARGETMGVFQLSGSGMTRWLKELKPTNIDDIMAMVALYRPGPMEFIPEYIKRKHNPETIDYPHPDLEEILEKSLGLLIYQDDVMLTAIKLAGYDWLEADKFRKAMGKKIPELMVEQGNQFKAGCIKNNISEDVVEDLWNRIKPFAAYGFNKAHAASYGMVAYQTAYMKSHYPVQFMTAILQAEFGDAEKVAAIVYECERMGIKVLPPDINESFRNFAMVSKHGEPGRIRFGLNAIKGLGQHISEVVYREKKDNGPYKTLEEFLERITDKDLNKKSLDALSRSGAMDCFGYDRGVLLVNMESMLFFTREHREKEVRNQDSLFLNTKIDIGTKVPMKSAEPVTEEQLLDWEKSLLGVYISSHPFKYFQKELGGGLESVSSIEEADRDKTILIGGVIGGFKKLITKKGSQMLFASVQDPSGSIELLVFPKTYEKTRDLWVENAVVLIKGKTPRESGDNKLFVESMILINKENFRNAYKEIAYGIKSSGFDIQEKKQKWIKVFLTMDEAKEKGAELKKLFRKKGGEYTVYVQIGTQTIKFLYITVDDDTKNKLKELVGENRIQISK